MGNTYPVIHSHIAGVAERYILQNIINDPSVVNICASEKGLELNPSTCKFIKILKIHTVILMVP